MHIRNYPEPSARDFEIYWAHMSDNISQKALAKQYKISAPRVSQIVKKTRAWIANKLPGKRESHAREQDGFVACFTRLHEVQKHQQEAYRLHLRQFQPQADGKTMRPDPRWLKLADDLSQRKEQVEDRLTLARNAAEDHLRKDGCYEEDEAVETARADIRIVKEAAEGMIRAGVCEPFELPPVDDAAIERTARDAIRRKNPGRQLRHQANLSAEWQAVVEQVYVRPLGGLCAEGEVKSETVEIPQKMAENAGSLNAYVEAMNVDEGATAGLPSSAPRGAGEDAYCDVMETRGSGEDAAGGTTVVHNSSSSDEFETTPSVAQPALLDNPPGVNLPAEDSGATFAEQKATLDAGSIGNEVSGEDTAGGVTVVHNSSSSDEYETKPSVAQPALLGKPAVAPEESTAKPSGRRKARPLVNGKIQFDEPKKGTIEWFRLQRDNALEARERAKVAAEEVARQRRLSTRNPSLAIRWEPSRLR